MISEFLSGLFAVFSLVAVGGILSLVLQRMARSFPFTRLSLILGLAPLSFFKFLEPGGSSTLFLYSMIVILLGITIDGISHLLDPRESPRAKAAPKKAEAGKEAEPAPGMIVWEKTE
ncbi:hypothetical protein [Pontiella desulfatans]|nr:hypothetical protein [Pontiella desulfatans]